MISVIMPAYNAERFVGEAIQSILNQSFRDFEIIMVDDGSTDRTVEIALNYGKQDSRLRVIVAEHGGVSRAINVGVDQAKYNWIARMDADDIALPHRLERQFSMVRSNPKVVAWGTYAYHISEKGRLLGLLKVGATTETEFYAQWRGGKPIHLIHPTALIEKKALIRAAGYNPLFDSCEDLEFFYRLSSLGLILAIPEPLLLYRIHGSSNTVRRFSEQRFFVRFIGACQQARAQGKEPPTLEEFRWKYANAPIFSRLHRRIDDMSQFFYRRFAVAVAAGQYVQAVPFFLCSAVFNPQYALPRAWKQRFARSARSYLNAAKNSLEANIARK